MFLKKIEFVNFKCFEKLSLSFENPKGSKDKIRKTTFILGENGVGKSALLKAIALITGGSNALGDLLGNADEWVKNGAKYCGITATITTEKGSERVISLRIDRGAHLGDLVERNKEALLLIDKAIKHSERNYFVLGYGVSRRLNKSGEAFFAKSSQRIISGRSTRVQTLFNQDATLVSLSNWALELDYAQGKTGIAIIKSALNNFLLENVIFREIDKEKGRIIFSTPDGDVPLEQLSDGYQNVAAWVGDLMYNITNTFKDYKDPLSARGLLLIDEIDLHLHPKWQRQLHAFLNEKLPHFQVIATTHSPLTAQQSREFELYALRREQKKIELVPFEGDPSKLLIHQLLMSPVFGLPTDESARVEEAREKVRAVQLKAKPTVREKESIKNYEALLQSLPAKTRTNTILNDKDIELLQAINKELGSKEK